MRAFAVARSHQRAGKVERAGLDRVTRADRNRLANGIPFPLTVREDVRLVAALADRAHQFSRVAALSSDLLFPDDRDAAGGEIDARPFRLFDLDLSRNAVSMVVMQAPQ